MKILFLIPEPFFVIRGSSVTMRAYIKTLAEAGHSIDVLCYAEGRDIETPKTRIWRIPSCMKISLLQDILLFIRALLMCIREKYDVIHAVNQSAFNSGWLKKAARAKLIYDLDLDPGGIFSSESLFIRKFRTATAEKLEQQALNAADIVLVSSKIRAAGVRGRISAERIIQIDDPPYELPVGENRDGGIQTRQEFGLGMAPVVLYTGSFDDFQQIELLLKAARLVHEQHPEVYFLLAGENVSEIPKLEHLAESLDIKDRCIYTPLRSISRISPLMAAASILVLPRLREARTYTKLFTYMLSNKVIVATKVQEKMHMLDQSCAILVLPQPDDLASGILRALNEPLIARGLAREAWGRIAADHSLPSFKHRVRRLYQKLSVDEDVD